MGVVETERVEVTEEDGDKDIVGVLVGKMLDVEVPVRLLVSVEVGVGEGDGHAGTRLG